ncbi:hypothetical protein BH18ACT4_BH18ACT4_04550 [soil metagenome]
MAPAGVVAGEPAAAGGEVTSATGAAARAVNCGQVITRTTRLRADVGPCSGDGVVIGADGISLDLNGHRIFGTPGPGDGQQAGVRLPSRTGVTVRNGTVSDFDAGVVLDRGQDNTVTGLTVSDNRGPDDLFLTAELGDGIILLNSAANSIIDNVVTNNGVYDGIGALGPDADDNVISGNTVTDTVGPSSGDQLGQCIVVNAAGLATAEGRVIVGTRIEDNLVRGNASAGIANVNNVDAQILRNVVEGNGLENLGNGIGLQLGPDAEATGTRALVQDNEVHGNGLDGIHVQIRASENLIIDNNAADNDVLDLSYIDAYDLHDLNPRCDSNTWKGNTWGSGSYFPRCTAIGGTGPARGLAAFIIGSLSLAQADVLPPARRFRSAPVA